MTVYTPTATLPKNFLLITRTLYSAADDTNSRGRVPKGEYAWPFVFHLPKGVQILRSAVMGKWGDKKDYRLPPTFADERGGIVIEYLLSVRANRAGLRAGSK